MVLSYVPVVLLRKVPPERYLYLLAKSLKMLDFEKSGTELFADRPKVILSLVRQATFPLIYIMIDFGFYRYFRKWNNQTNAVHIYSFINSKRFAPCPRFTETFDIDSLTDNPCSLYSLYFCVAYAFRQV